MSRRVSRSALLNAEVRRLQKVSAILTCVDVASEFAEEKIDLGDAVRVALKLVRESVSGLDQLTTGERHARHSR